MNPETFRNRQRAETFALAEYFGWAARKGYPGGGNDPRTGLAWNGSDPLARAIGRAEHIAAARATYRHGRIKYGPIPLP